MLANRFWSLEQTHRDDSDSASVFVVVNAPEFQSKLETWDGAPSKNEENQALNGKRRGLQCAERLNDPEVPSKNNNTVIFDVGIFWS